jgi:O-antigen biosynthesis protein
MTDTDSVQIQHQNPRNTPGKSSFAARVHIPFLLHRLLPGPIKNGLRKLRAQILLRDFQRHVNVEPSIEDNLASAAMSIIVPIHDAPVVTRRCLASLEAHASKAEVILVNDGSSLIETNQLIDEFVNRNKWKLVHHEKPLGHSAASEAGAGLANRPILCLLNSDTVVTPWCWGLVKKTFEQNPDVAVAGPSTSNSGNIQTLPVAGYLRDYWNDNQICDFAKRLTAECAEPVIAELAWVSGFAFFIRRNVWDQLGGFDQHLPDYGNELELCKRVTANGYRRVWVRNAYVHHLGGQSYGTTIGAEAIKERKTSTLNYIENKGQPAGK